MKIPARTSAKQSLAPTRCRALTGGLVTLVHHTGKDASKGMRGHSALHAAMGAVLEVTRDASGTRQWTLAKSKDGEGGITKGFIQQIVHFGTDTDGDSVTSCAIQWDRPVRRRAQTFSRPA